MVRSGQDEVHRRLRERVLKHLDSHWSQPYHRPSLDSYEKLKNTGLLTPATRLVMDSACGTGESSRRLAQKFPRHIVLGVDQSATRLAGSGMKSDVLMDGNRVLVRAELSTFWRLLARDGYLLERHFLFYPNPWPKAAHLARRWHGHPVFPQLLMLGGEIELRCNWEIYAREFALAVQVATGEAVEVKPVQSGSAVSPFEKKYRERGQALFKVVVPAPLTAAFRQKRAGHR